MINRSYLPFQSAREYVDRGMAKWMGFFISEHSSSLAKEDDTIDYSGQMKPDYLSLLLAQAYIHKLTVLLHTNKRKRPFLGLVYEISEEKIYFRSQDEMTKINFEDIIRLELLEEENEK